MIVSVKSYIKYYFLAVLAAAALLVWSAVWAEDRGGILTVSFLNVGQGDAILTVWMLYTHSYSKLSSLI
ncbi:MAG: hypothetical protein AAB378_01455 [Patescibacteria group bacterium]